MPGLPPIVPAIQIVASSTGMSKGIAQTNGPQLLGRAELRVGDFYFGGYAKNTELAFDDGEAGPVGGYRTQIAGMKIGVGATFKYAINPIAGTNKTALELNGSISLATGKLRPVAAVYWSPKELGPIGRSLYVEGGAVYTLTKTVSASAAIGRRHRSALFDYTAWNAGATWAPRKHITLDARYYDTDAGSGHAYRPRFVVTGALSF